MKRGEAKEQRHLDNVYDALSSLWYRLTDDAENMAAALFITAMSVYYLWRILFLTPWYDELYTYYYFISRGPVYAAIHWPLPNNHVGYSVLSGIVDVLTGSSYLGLRGVSLIAAICNLILIYRIGKKMWNGWYAFFCLLLYSGLQLVNLLSVQGRGYTLTTFCLLLATFMVCHICQLGKTPRRYYICLGMCLVLGLYTVPSSVYWVIPLGLSGVLFLLINGLRIRDKKNPARRDENLGNPYLEELRRLIWVGVISAAITLFLYLIIWLAIGSNLLLNEVEAYAGWGHISIILRHPLQSVMRGITYMLATPYIQSVERQGYLVRLLEWLLTLGNQFVPGLGIVVCIATAAGFVILIRDSILHLEESKTALRICIILVGVCMPVFLIVQCKLPYYRVFSYYGAIVAACTTVVLRRLLQLLQRLAHGRWERFIGALPALLGCGYMLCMVLWSGFFSQLGERENLCYQALLIAEPETRSNICVLDVDQQYLLKFGWGIECENTDPIGADLVLVDKNMLEPQAEGNSEAWKYFQTYETLDTTYLKKMHQIYENQEFILYVK